MIFQIYFGFPLGLMATTKRSLQDNLKLKLKRSPTSSAVELPSLRHNLDHKHLEAYALI